jgi:hypothetical protein
MKLPTPIRAVIVATAFIGIWAGAITAMPKAYELFLDQPFSSLGLEVAFIGAAAYAPLWMPLCLVGFAIGRRRLSAWILVAAVVAEGLALLVTASAFWYLSRP